MPLNLAQKQIKDVVLHMKFYTSIKINPIKNNNSKQQSKTEVVTYTKRN